MERVAAIGRPHELLGRSGLARDIGESLCGMLFGPFAGSDHMPQQPFGKLGEIVDGARIDGQRTRRAVVDADLRVGMEAGVDDDMCAAEQDEFVAERALDVDRIDFAADERGEFGGIKRAAAPAVARSDTGRIVARGRIARVDIARRARREARWRGRCRPSGCCAAAGRCGDP
jgi:hypothetical protein